MCVCVCLCVRGGKGRQLTTVSCSWEDEVGFCTHINTLSFLSVSLTLHTHELWLIQSQPPHLPAAAFSQIPALLQCSLFPKTPSFTILSTNANAAHSAFHLLPQLSFGFLYHPSLFFFFTNIAFFAPTNCQIIDMKYNPLYRDALYINDHFDTEQNE